MDVMLVCGIILIVFLLNVLFKNSIYIYDLICFDYDFVKNLWKYVIKKKNIIIDNFIWNFNV